MERVIYNCSATPVTPQQRTMGQARRYEGELDARKPARPVRWRGKALSSLDDMLIPLSFKWSRTCAYCGKQNIPLQVEHIVPRTKGGTDRISNLTLACEKCNTAKGTQEIAVFLTKKPYLLKRILAQAKTPLKDAAAVNTTRWVLYKRLKAIGFPIECGSGGLTKYNRTMRTLPKTHWLDAACVGKSTPQTLQIQGIIPLRITATGYGNRQMCGTDKRGFPTRHRQRKKVHHGFQTGDLARAIVPQGTHAGVHVGRVLTRASGSFDLNTAHGRIGGIAAHSCQPIHRNDGYSYQSARGTHSSPGLKACLLPTFYLLGLMKQPERPGAKLTGSQTHPW